ncbi:solute carrier family 2, facilitated glucose transporter member 8 isoform X3 [Stigmatopora nigra]
MDIQQERKSLLNADGRDDDPSGLISEYEAYLSKVNNSKLYLATLVSVLGPLSFGFVLGYSSPAIPELAGSTDPRLRLDNVQASWFGSVVTLGAAAGGLLTGCIVDRAGRKLTLMFCSLPFVFGFTIIIAAQDVWMLYAGRVLTGLASGGTSLVVPLYISEMAHERVRGTLGSCVQLMVVLGIIGVYLAGLFVDWRWLALCAAVPPTLLVASMWFMPETPRFLLSQRKQHEAKEALRFLRGPHAAVEWEFTRLEGACNQQESDLASVMVGTVQLFFTCVAALIMDKAGRKVLLVISGLVMVISTAAFGLYFHLMSRSASPEEHHANMAWLALLSMVVFISDSPHQCGNLLALLMHVPPQCGLYHHRCSRNQRPDTGADRSKLPRNSWTVMITRNVINVSRGGRHPGQPIAGNKEMDNHVHTSIPRDNSEWPISLSYMFCSVGGCLEDPEETHSGLGRTCKLPTGGLTWI